MFDDDGDKDVGVVGGIVDMAVSVMARARSPEGILVADGPWLPVVWSREDVPDPGGVDRGMDPGLDTLIESPGAVGETLRKLSG